jgi:hypothetical protein
VILSCMVTVISRINLLFYVLVNGVLILARRSKMFGRCHIFKGLTAALIAILSCSLATNH